MWIESHQELDNHPKTKRALRKLGITLPTLIGHLHLLWHWALDYADDGNLAGYTDEDIAEAAMWEGDPAEFIEALVSCGVRDEHGFLERTDGGALLIHDWSNYAGKLIERRAANAQRMRDSRALHVQNTSTSRVEMCEATVPTVPTIPNQQDQPNHVAVAIAPAKTQKPAKVVSEKKETHGPQMAALAGECGMDIKKIPKSALAILAKQAIEAMNVGWSPDDIHSIATRWREECPTYTLSPSVIIRHGARLLSAPARASPNGSGRPNCAGGVNGGEPERSPVKNPYDVPTRHVWAGPGPKPDSFREGVY